MLMLLRLLGVWLLLLAMVAAVVDATKSLAGGGAWVVTPMGEQWKALSPETLEGAKAGIQTHAAPFLWDPVMLTILAAPAWSLFGVFGILMILAGRRKKPLIGYVRP